MQQKYRRAGMWALFSVFFLLVLLLQTTVFGDRRYLGAKLSFLPVAVACIAAFNGHEAGALFGLAAGFFWACAGGSDGSVSMVTFTLIGIFAGWLCDAVFARRLLPLAAVCLGALVLHQLTVYLFQRLLSGADAPFVWVIWETLLSWPLVLIGYPICRLIRKAGGA